MKNKLIITLLNIFLTTASFTLLSKADVVEPHIDFHSIPAGHFDRLVESVVLDEVFTIKGVTDRPNITGQVWSDWKNNFININGDVNSVKLTFEDRLTNTEESSSRAPSFTMQVLFEDKRFIADRMGTLNTEGVVQSEGIDSLKFVFKHSRAASQNELQGIRLSVNESTATRVYYNGLDKTGVAIFAPKTPRTGFAGGGVILCPRDFDIWKVKGGSRVLKNSNYQVSSVSFDGQGVAQARVASGLGPGHAKAVVQTSRNMLANQLVVDESFSTYPYAATDYQAVKEQLSPAIMNSGDGVTAGMKLQTIHHNSFKHKTVTSVVSTVTVKNVMLQKQLRFIFGNKTYSIEAGQCVAIVKENAITQEHTKQKLPERSLQKPEAQPSVSNVREGEHLFEEIITEEKKGSPLDDLLKDVE